VDTDQNLKGLDKWLIQALRRISYRWPPRSLVMKEARVARGKYRCAECGEVFGRQEVQVDHVHPVINPETGFVDWNTYIARLFCPKSGWQILCKPDHHKKSAQENAIRREQPKVAKKRRTKSNA